MKKIISGKQYNTETATALVSMTNGRMYDDFAYYEATIYRTEKGQLFLYESGGARSKMSVSVGNNGTGGSSDICLLTDSVAVELVQEWHADNNLDHDETKYALENLGVKIQEG